ncbi:hypothetical protein [Paenarthrobacter aurescens]|uniref:O-methyltransferase domain-containing protein n=1 Tax=Paenarthrobacter aurescens (strain TC1) TaxID=290340 RepID=A1R3X8_PAEAT|nr:hypothetical protein [Paenarthrobacter aurescens]ABM08489.1 hypothetical protein AAur_1153 [Paenarthrobacter aurescens TC1]
MSPSPTIASVHFANVAGDFGKAISEVLDRDGVLHPPSLVAELTRHIADDGFESDKARYMLVSSGVRAAWNMNFAEQRSRAVADWVAPHLCGQTKPAVDLLAGDCRLTGMIAARTGQQITALERVGHFDDIIDNELIDFVPWEDGDALPHTDTIFLGAVLHHERDPQAILDAVMSTTATKLVVLENCIDEDFSGDLHPALDLFFNQTLNQFGSDCVREHRTAAEWEEFLAPFGVLVHYSELSPVPALPFPYQLMVFKRDAV